MSRLATCTCSWCITIGIPSKHRFFLWCCQHIRTLWAGNTQTTGTVRCDFLNDDRLSPMDVDNKAFFNGHWATFLCCTFPTTTCVVSTLGIHEQNYSSLPSDEFTYINLSCFACKKKVNISWGVSVCVCGGLATKGTESSILFTQWHRHACESSF